MDESVYEKLAAAGYLTKHYDLRKKFPHVTFTDGPCIAIHKSATIRNGAEIRGSHSLNHPTTLHLQAYVGRYATVCSGVTIDKFGSVGCHGTLGIRSSVGSKTFVPARKTLKPHHHMLRVGELTVVVNDRSMSKQLQRMFRKIKQSLVAMLERNQIKTHHDPGDADASI